MIRRLFPRHDVWWPTVVMLCGALVVLVLLMLLIGCTRSISTGVRDTCNDSNDSKDNQYACWLAQESGDGPDE